MAEKMLIQSPGVLGSLHPWLFPSPRPALLPAFSLPCWFPGRQGRGCPQPSQQASLLPWKLLPLARGLCPAEIGVFFNLLGWKDCGDWLYTQEGEETPP